jgi:hypothetical protein
VAWAAPEDVVEEPPLEPPYPPEPPEFELLVEAVLELAVELPPVLVLVLPPLPLLLSVPPEPSGTDGAWLPEAEEAELAYCWMVMPELRRLVSFSK